jgi:SRSO17 transposase
LREAPKARPDKRDQRDISAGEDAAIQVGPARNTPRLWSTRRWPPVANSVSTPAEIARMTKATVLPAVGVGFVEQLVGLAHQRSAIEQDDRDFKSELGLGHFEGRSSPGWQHHIVTSAVAVV